MKSKNNKIKFKKMKLKKLIKKLKESHISFMISRTKNGYNTLIIDAKIIFLDCNPEISNCVFVLNYYNKKLMCYNVKVNSFHEAIIDFIPDKFDMKIKIYGGKKFIDYQTTDNIFNLENTEYIEVKRYLDIEDTVAKWKSNV